MTVIASDLIAKLDHVLKTGSPDLRTRMLQEVAGLFLEDAHRLGARHVEVFDDILIRLTESVELRTLTTLSRSLADLHLVPRELARRLANHDDADVAAPILRRCECIPESDLIDIAWMRAEGHLGAIAGRKAVSQELTDILLMRGDSSVLRVLASNPGADMTSAGLAMMVDAAERDEGMAGALIARKDLPDRVLADLVMRSTPRQQARLLKLARPGIQHAIRAAIDASTARAPANPPATIDDAQARSG
ncbi:DUF2336 domain-containing protein [Bradyrhizobium viridifuturi]|jgi:uncharacterized protein (DUF2336 family)|uniref:DUF2336 domain-containing protein n=2 Tax=Nitrobacteraceae TaxID=41294 RepID=UPI0003969CA9|nr:MULTISPECIES: DUF2336 domain-containing protein [Bradyrhizobium]ERF81487.1 MAG: hypothetical protein C207_05325 [Bradyrhizobium sp. DFCI-1]OYU59857.1 MAG: hypothetical protein CFE30_23660 [Bradyrhizobium sp. PARBB1]PSO28535.1 DUF2336 domain-containing protein [Bradyrhizobium sp. MOS004]QRI72557.1 DUF2336 domain-containing protein [Bradyrhizobium sp. PSBB068]MBR1021142.1 DUF2336 domain-containing protein [Bradyrhizobium viridifuturi]